MRFCGGVFARSEIVFTIERDWFRASLGAFWRAGVTQKVGNCNAECDFAAALLAVGVGWGWGPHQLRGGKIGGRGSSENLWNDVENLMQNQILNRFQKDLEKF